MMFHRFRVSGKRIVRVREDPLRTIRRSIIASAHDTYVALEIHITSSFKKKLIPLFNRITLDASFVDLLHIIICSDVIQR